MAVVTWHTITSKLDGMDLVQIGLCAGIPAAIVFVAMTIWRTLERARVLHVNVPGPAVMAPILTGLLPAVLVTVVTGILYPHLGLWALVIGGATVPLGAVILDYATCRYLTSIWG